MSDVYQIENSSLILQINSKGAEMRRLFSKEWGRELLWPGDEKTWNRSAPVLFPIVGKLKDGHYDLHGKTYTMPQHGFARDYEFKCLRSNVSEIEFSLVASQQSFTMYPFCFVLNAHYKVEGSRVNISYTVKNDDRQTIFFSIGAHPAFETSELENYEIKFQKDEKEFYLTTEGLVDWRSPCEFAATQMPISKDTFKSDALIFKNMNSRYVDLINKKTKEIIRISAVTPFFGIWGKGDVPFVCLEPWQGVSDEVTHDKNFTDKIGIISLEIGKTFEFSYSIEIMKRAK